MGEAKRRRIEQGLRAVHRQSREGGFGPTGGAMEAVIIRQSLLATTYAHYLAQFFSHVLDGSRNGKPPLCLACDHEFRVPGPPPAALSVPTPIHRKPEQAIVTAICGVCADLGDDVLLEHAYQGLKKIGIAACLEPLGVPADSGGLFGVLAGAGAATTTRLFLFLPRLFINRLPLGGGSNYQVTQVAF